MKIRRKKQMKVLIHWGSLSGGSFREDESYVGVYIESSLTLYRYHYATRNLISCKFTAVSQSVRCFPTSVLKLVSINTHSANRLKYLMALIRAVDARKSNSLEPHGLRPYIGFR